MTQEELNDYIIEQMKPIVEAAVLAERESCAKVCDMYSERWMFGETPVSEQTLSLMKRCAASIRTRGNNGD